MKFPGTLWCDAVIFNFFFPQKQQQKKKLDFFPHLPRSCCCLRCSQTREGGSLPACSFFPWCPWGAGDTEGGAQDRRPRLAEPDGDNSDACGGKASWPLAAQGSLASLWMECGGFLCPSCSHSLPSSSGKGLREAAGGSWCPRSVPKAGVGWDQPHLQCWSGGFRWAGLGRGWAHLLCEEGIEGSPCSWEPLPEDGGGWRTKQVWVLVPITQT